VSLEWGPLSLVRIIEERLVRTVAALVYKTEINDRRDSLRWPRNTLYPLKLALTSPTSGGRSVGIVRWRTKSRSSCYVLTILRAIRNSVMTMTSLALTKLVCLYIEGQFIILLRYISFI
jgi:hypothetical protein